VILSRTGQKSFYDSETEDINWKRAEDRPSVAENRTVSLLSRGSLSRSDHGENTAAVTLRLRGTARRDREVNQKQELDTEFSR
jgi:hypothetical protein